MRAALPGLLVAALLLVATSRFSSVGAGPLLWPPTDAVEYASMASWMARGEGPVLRIGPAYFPARVPPATSVLLLPTALVTGADASWYPWSILALGIAGLAAVFRLGTLLGLDRRGALAAAAAVALSPGFACYSGVVMSDVPALVFLLAALLAFRRAIAGPGPARASLLALGFAAGALVAFRVTNALWWVALFACAPRRLLRASRPAWLAAAALLAALPVAATAFHQWRVYEAPWRTGYHYWGEKAGFLRPGFDLRWALSDEARVHRSYYRDQLLGLRSDIFGSRGWKSDLCTLPLAILGLVGVGVLLVSLPRGSPERAVLLALGTGTLLSLGLNLGFSNPHFRDWRYVLPWTVLLACGAGALLDRGAAALSRRGRSGAWVYAAGVGAIAAAFVLPLPPPVPGEDLAIWRAHIEAERALLAAVPAGNVWPTQLPLALAAVLAPPGAVLVPAREGNLADPILSTVWRDGLRPLRVDEGREPLWDALARRASRAADR